MLKVEKRIEDDKVYLALEGELDTLTAPDFQAVLEPLLPDASSVTLDFEKLNYVSSAGLRLLMIAEQTMEDKGAEKIRVKNMNDVISEIFDITGFKNILDLN